MPNDQPKPTSLGVCRGCGVRSEIPNRDWLRRRVRCLACGGVMDRVKPKFYRRTPKGPTVR
jgi:hypothetical protein